MQGYFLNIVSNVSKDLQILQSSLKAAVPEKVRKGKEVSIACCSYQTSPPPPQPTEGSKSKPFKWNLSLNMHTLSVKFPASGNTSAEAVRVQLDSLLLSNKYSSGHELSGAGGESYLSVLEMMQLDFHQLSVSR
jgi:hypothetical protein